MNPRAFQRPWRVDHVAGGIFQGMGHLDTTIMNTPPETFRSKRVGCKSFSKGILDLTYSHWQSPLESKTSIIWNVGCVPCRDWCAWEYGDIWWLTLYHQIWWVSLRGQEDLICFFTLKCIWQASDFLGFRQKRSLSRDETPTTGASMDPRAR